jgi:hypothetical protein
MFCRAHLVIAATIGLGVYVAPSFDGRTKRAEDLTERIVPRFDFRANTRGYGGADARGGFRGLDLSGAPLADRAGTEGERQTDKQSFGRDLWHFL